VSPKSELGFLCAFDSVVPKYCGFYRFYKEYLQMLKDVGVIVFDRRTGQTWSMK
jgi:hypothetical protein